ncbi:11537_t:CDS:2 [Diversispora eburnea]|uniref:11537_t:CDS:1 n=1 Tax=Diversispora eburnea TaxID=1213867 RepID=A0A9N8ZNA1_9GLOM|nr:11537_t:CDS:2 [Diversispora eburnea]
MNLSAVSLSQQTFFVAVDTIIHVYRLLEEENPTEVAQDSSLREPIKKLQLGMLGFEEVLVCVDDFGEVCVWYTANLDRTPIRFINEESTWGIALHGPKRLLAVSSNSHKITIYDLRNGLKDPKNPNDMDLSENVNIQGTSFLPSTSKLDKNGILHYSLVGHTHNIPNISFSPCGQYLVSCSVDCSCRVWNVQTGGEIVGKDISRLWGWSARFVSSSSFEFVPENKISKTITIRKPKNRTRRQNNQNNQSDINIMNTVIRSHISMRERVLNLDSEYEDGYFFPPEDESFESKRMYGVREFVPSIDYERERDYESDSRTIPMTDDEWTLSSENHDREENEQVGVVANYQYSHWVPREYSYSATSPPYSPQTPQYFNFAYSNSNSEHRSVPPPPTPRPASANFSPIVMSRQTSSGYLVSTPNRQPPNNPRTARFTPISPTYFPTSPAYVLSPTYSPTSPQYSEMSPVYSPTSPNHIESPNYGNTSPISNYSNSTLNYGDTSNHEATSSNREDAISNCPVTPDYGTITPTYESATPAYEPATRNYGAITPDYGSTTSEYGNTSPNYNPSPSYGATSFSPIREETPQTIYDENYNDTGSNSDGDDSPNNEFGMQPPSPLFSPSTPYSIPTSPTYREAREDSTIDDTSESRYSDTPISLDDDSSLSSQEEQSSLQSRESPGINAYDNYDNNASPSHSTTSGESSGRRSYERQSNYSPTYIRLVRRNLSLFTDLNDNISTDESGFTRISDRSIKSNNRTKKKSILKKTPQQKSQNAINELILFGTQTDLYLLDPKSDLCILDCKKSIVTRNDIRRGMNIAEFERLNMIEYVPELSLAIVASQKGEINYSLHPEINLPTFPLPPSPLLGMFIVKNENLPKNSSLFYCCLYLIYLNGEFYCYDIRKSEENYTLGVPEKIWL